MDILSSSVHLEESIHPVHSSTWIDKRGPHVLTPRGACWAGTTLLFHLRSGNAVGALRTLENEADVESTQADQLELAARAYFGTFVVLFPPNFFCNFPFLFHELIVNND